MRTNLCNALVIQEKPPISVDSRMCVLKPCRQKGAQSLRCESRIFVGLRRVSLLQIVQIITVHVTARPNQRQTVSAWANHVGSMLLGCLDSDADASVVVVLLQWLNQLRIQETLENTRRSLGTRPRQDYAHRVHPSARWSPMYHYLALTSLRDNHPMPTRHIREPGADRRLFFSHFRTSVSVLRFPFQRFPLAPPHCLFLNRKTDRFYPALTLTWIFGCTRKFI